MGVSRDQLVIAGLYNQGNQLAMDVLTMAANGGMPDSFWLTDQRILRACHALSWEPEYARQWAQENKVVN